MQILNFSLRKQKIVWLAIVTFSIGLCQSAAAAPPPEDGIMYTFQADDTLQKLAEKYYNDPLAYPTIIQATNAQATTDDRFTAVEVPAQMVIGQHLFIPNVTPGIIELVPAKTLRGDTGPTAEQQELLASLQSKGVPPELHSEVWLNSEPLKLADLKGKVVIVEFWTYG